ncbi:MAG: hypothetical protein KDI33_04370 [Halioglobus sp.]|nr:hypothetical protein [Halioglobus sp.]
MNVSREAVALTTGVILCILAVTPFVLAIKYLDGGVGLILVSPVLIWLLLRAGKKLERWARNEPDTTPPDPDYPDNED